MDIDPKLAELLNKVRKGATSDMRVGAWEKVLTHLGYRCKIVKDRNTAVEFRVVTPDGTELVELKNPDYKWITMGDMSRYLNEHGVRGQAAEALGMDVDQEKKDRETAKLYKRDLVNTGTCGVCLGNYKRESDGTLHHHGYTRPGDGWLHGSCYGVGYQPWELSKLAVVGYVRDVLEPALQSRELKLRPLLEDRVEMFRDKVYVWQGRQQVAKSVGVFRDNKYDFNRLRQQAIAALEGEIKMIKEDIKRCETQISRWKPDELPEVKYAGKFRR
jgi:hypothetical protein